MMNIMVVVETELLCDFHVSSVTTSTTCVKRKSSAGEVIRYDATELPALYILRVRAMT